VPKKLKVKIVLKGKKVVIKDILEKHWARENGLLETAVYVYKEGSLKTGL